MNLDYQNKEAMIDFIENVLGLTFGHALTEDNLTLITNEVVDKNFQDTRSDLVYLVQVEDIQLFIYLFLELQSTVDYRMPARLLFYMANQLQLYYQNQNFNSSDSKIKLPAVYPVVLYNGLDPWKAPTTLRQIFHNEELFDNGLLNFEYAT